tara:strand:+ start:311 stop:775 length:465 start_codon:yes stop_codon:yes gene_type:complete
MKIEQRYDYQLTQHSDASIAAYERGEVISDFVRDMTLGESQSRTFLAHVGHGFNPKAEDYKAELTRALKTVNVLKVAKRYCMVQVGDVIMLCNKFGVCSYKLLLPCKYRIGNFAGAHFSLLDSRALLRVLGAVHDGWSRGDVTYNYSPAARLAA